MEDQSLLRGGASHGVWRSKLFLLVLFLFVATLATTITFSVLYANEVKKNKEIKESILPPVVYDPTDDFPLAMPQAWDVSANHTNRLTFDTSNGTWLNVDLSPDGTHLIFDMLGDIYSLFLNQAGGAATLLRGGVAFETQPRFSPDGSKIVFTSDLSGCDNLWIMDLATKAQTQVTFETYHFVSNAYWIDANTLVAVKWYTSTRSIGAGEIWTYPVVPPTSTSNPGKRIVGRSAAGAQVGPEEPVARTVNNRTSIFYSKNVADGYSWSYSKDPHQVIYVIYELDLTSGQTSVIASGPGGSARPIISRSGNLLAYIKRTVFVTSLIIHDLNTGNERILTPNLDFDQQESYAPAGVYPGFSFTPDDGAIVIWAKGLIYSINVATGEAIQIPFTATVDMNLSPTVRFNHSAADEPTFNTRIVTTPSASGNKETFAFTTLATTYLYQTKNGLIEALTPEQDGVFQFWPSISRDNQFLVHVLWNDYNLSTIQVYNLETRATYTVPTPPGRYAQPQFSPAGNNIVYTRLPADSLSGTKDSLNNGIYMSTFSADIRTGSISFGSPTFISDSVVSPVFSEDGKSIIGQAGGYPMAVSEISIEDGAKFGAETDLVVSLYSTEVAVSPNKAYVAFVEFQKVYVASFSQANGKAMNATSIGVSTTAHLASPRGQYLSWSYDSATLYWAWGPLIYELSVPDLKSCKESEDCLSSKVKTYNVSVVANSTLVTDQVAVFINATILTMDNDNPTISNGTLVVQGGRIRELGAGLDVPSDATNVYDVQGGYIMPGYVDTHAHWQGAWDAAFKVSADWEMFVNLAYGVTTLHNPSADSISVFQDAELIRAGKKVGPRIFSTGKIIYGAGGPSHCDIASYSDAQDYLLTLQAVGAWSAKSYNQPCRAARQRILAAARDLEMNVVPEGGMSFYWNLNQIIDGHTTIEHAIPMAPLYNDVVTLFARSGTAWTPTFIVNYGGIFGERYWFQHTNVWEDPRLTQYVPDDIVQPTTMRYVGAQDVDYHHFATSQAVADVFANGGIVEAGAHGEMQGIGIHWEMKMFNQSGALTPYQVLQTATINPALALGLSNDIGSLKVGKLADLIFYNVSNNPLELDTENVNWVMKNGFLYDALTMDQLLPFYKPRAALPELNTPSATGVGKLYRRKHHP